VGIYLPDPRYNHKNAKTFTVVNENFDKQMNNTLINEYKVQKKYITKAIEHMQTTLQPQTLQNTVSIHHKTTQ